MDKQFLTDADNFISKLNEDQLRELNKRIVNKLKLIRQAKNAAGLARFNIGDRVYFEYEGEKVLGKVIRLNKKSATIKTDQRGNWLVDPNFLNKVIEG
jgi:hypothetical protein